MIKIFILFVLVACAHCLDVHVDSVSGVDVVNSGSLGSPVQTIENAHAKILLQSDPDNQVILIDVGPHRLPGAGLALPSFASYTLRSLNAGGQVQVECGTSGSVGLSQTTDSNVLIEDVHFTSCPSNGIVGGAFRRLIGAVGEFTARRSRFEECGTGSSANGGALAIESTAAGQPILVDQCEFVDCVAAQGSAIYVGSAQATLDIVDSSFNVTFESAIAVIGADSVRIDGCHFEQCTTTGDGGAVNVINANMMSVANSLFKANGAGSGGGAIWFSSSNPASSVALRNLTASMCQANEGGFASVEGAVGGSSGQLLVESVRAVDCKAAADGGVFFVSDFASVDMSGLCVSNASASDNGGALYASSIDSISLSDVECQGCEAQFNHGGFARIASLFALTVDGFVGANVHSQNSGGVFELDQVDVASLRNVECRQCSSRNGRGGFLSLSDAAGNVTLEAFRGFDVHANEEGGVLHGDTISKLVIRDAQCTDCSASRGSFAHVAESLEGRRGGAGPEHALYISELHCHDCPNSAVHHEGQLDWAHIADSSCTECHSARDGGFVYIDFGVDWLLVERVACTNASAQYGGCVHLDSGVLDSATVVDFNCTGCAANVGDGAALYINDAADELRVYVERFAGVDCSTQGGGALFLPSAANVSVVASSCHSCSSAANGGMVYVDDSNSDSRRRGSTTMYEHFEFDGITCVDCSCSGTGSAIIVAVGGTVGTLSLRNARAERCTNTFLYVTSALFVGDVTVANFDGRQLYASGEGSAVNFFRANTLSVVDASCVECEATTGGFLYANQVDGPVRLERVACVDTLANGGSGGMLFLAQSGDSFTMLDSSCANCSATMFGGVVFFSGSTVDDSALTVDGFAASGCQASQGGALYFGATSYGVLAVHSATCLSCTATSGAGGFVFATNVSDATFASVECVDASTVTIGGAVFLGQARRLLNMTGVKGTRVHADNPGGFLYVGDVGESVHVERFECNACTSGFHGGAAYVGGVRDTFTMLDSSCSNCSAAQSGGAWLVSNGASPSTATEVLIDGFVCQDCEAAASSGGALFFEAQHYPSVTIRNSACHRCAASDGDGGFAFFANRTLSAQLSQLDLIDCEASVSGGAVSFGGDVARLNVIEVSCSRCTAGRSGGFVALAADVADIYLELFDCAECHSAGASTGGGAIYASSISLSFTMVDSTCSNCTSQQLGGVVATDFGSTPANNITTIDINNFTGAGCHSTINGGAFYMANALYSSVSVVQSSCHQCSAGGGGGGFFYVADASQVAFGELDLRDCTATVSIAGAIYVGTADTLNVTDTTCTRCQSQSPGGFMLAGTVAGPMRVDNFHCTECHTVLSTGGALHVGAAETFDIIDSSCTNCSAAAPGGFAYTNQLGRSFRAINVDCVNCRSEIHGGAFYIDGFALAGATLELIDMTCNDCTAAQLGGAVYQATPPPDSVLIDGFVGTDCHAEDGRGGAFYLDGMYASIEVRQSSCSSCTASSDGGFLYVADYVDVLLVDDFVGTMCVAGVDASFGGGAFMAQIETMATLNNVACTDCHALGPSGGGGLAYLDGDTLQDKKRGDTYEWQLGVSMLQCIDCSAPGGGALHLGFRASGRYELDGVHFERCTATQSHGGAIFAVNADDYVTVRSLYARDVSTQRNGGVLYMQSATEPTVATIEGADVSHLSAANGALFAMSGSMMAVNVSSVQASQCEASNRGGLIAIEFQYDALYMDSVHCVSCTSVNGGGGLLHAGLFVNRIYASGVHCEQCSSNSTSEGGGAIYVDSPWELELRDSIFDDCWARESGGALAFDTVYVSGGSMTLFNVTVREGGSFEGDGGAMFVAGPETPSNFVPPMPMLLDSCTIEANRAFQGSGGALYLTAPVALVLRNTDVTDNYASSYGGGLSVEVNSTLVESTSSLVRNCAGIDFDTIENRDGLDSVSLEIGAIVVGCDGYIWVNEESGDDRWGVGTQRFPYKTLARGVAELNADVSDTIQLDGSLPFAANDYVITSGNDVTLLGPATIDCSGNRGLTFSSASNVHVADVSMLNCASSSNGAGALHVLGTAQLLLLERCTFTQCDGMHGGAVSTFGIQEVRAYDTSFGQCSASANGGGLFASGAELVLLDHVDMDQCTSLGDGGALFVTGITEEPLNVTLASCIITRSQSVSGRGGGVHAQTESLSRRRGSKSGPEHTLQLVNTVVNTCDAVESGGCISVEVPDETQRWTLLELSQGSQVHSCVSESGNGGGIVVDSLQYGALLDGSRVEHCQAQGGYGGGIMLTNANVSLQAPFALVDGSVVRYNCAYYGDDAIGLDGVHSALLVDVDPTSSIEQCPTLWVDASEGTDTANRGTIEAYPLASIDAAVAEANMIHPAHIRLVGSAPFVLDSAVYVDFGVRILGDSSAATIQCSASEHRAFVFNVSDADQLAALRGDAGQFRPIELMTVDVLDCDASDSQDGGALLIVTPPNESVIDNTPLPFVVVDDVRILDSAARNGGGVAVVAANGGQWSAASDAAVILNDVTVRRNNASANGGGLYVSGARVHLSGASVLSENCATLLGDSMFNDTVVDIDTGVLRFECGEIVCATLNDCNSAFGQGECIGTEACSCFNSWQQLDCSVCGLSCGANGAVDAQCSRCVCQGGWAGARCDRCPVTEQGGCQNGGTFSAQQCQCTCPSDWSGTVCTQPVCTPQNCNGHGTCVPLGVCSCESGYLPSSQCLFHEQSPRMTGARFVDASLSTVEVTWSEPVRAVASGELMCSTYLAIEGQDGATFGSKCTLDVADSVTRLTMLSDATLLPDARLRALVGVGKLVAAANPLWLANGSAVLQTLDPVPKIALTLLGVRTLSSCSLDDVGALRWTASVSSGLLGRAPSTMKYVWSLSDAGAASLSVATTNALGNEVRINGLAALAGGTNFVLSVTAVNALGTEQAASESIEKRAENDVPTLSVAPLSTPSRSKDFYVTAVATLSNCVSADDVTFAFVWRSEPALLLEDLKSLRSAQLIVPRANWARLAGGTLVKLFVQLNQARRDGTGLPIIVNYVVEVEAPYAPLDIDAVSAPGGTHRANAPLSLAVIATHAEFPALQSSIEYAWRCERTDGSTAPCAESLDLSSATGATVTIAAATIASMKGSAYEFIASARLNVESIGREFVSEELSLVRTVTPLYVPEINVTVSELPGGGYIIELEAGGPFDSKSLRFEFELFDVTDAMFVRATNALASATCSSTECMGQVDRDLMRIIGILIDPEEEERRRGSATDLPFDLLVQVPIAPSSPLPGDCQCGSVSLTGPAVVGNFWVACADWQANAPVSGSSALLYKASAYNTSNGALLLSVGPSTLSNLSLPLPAGDAIEVRVDVRNDDGGASLFSAPHRCTYAVTGFSGDDQDDVAGALLDALGSGQLGGPDGVAALTSFTDSADEPLDDDTTDALVDAVEALLDEIDLTGDTIAAAAALIESLTEAGTLDEDGADDLLNALLALLAGLSTPGNADNGLPALDDSVQTVNNVASDSSYDQLLLAIDAVQHAFLNVSGQCGGRPFVQSGDSVTVSASADYADNVANSTLNAGGPYGANFLLSDEVLAELGSRCVRWIMSSFSFATDSRRLPASQLTLVDEHGNEIPIEGLSDNAVLIAIPIPDDFEVPEVDEDDDSSCNNKEEGELTVTCEVLVNATGDNLEWSGEGCEYVDTLNNVVFCQCSHLSNFGVLFGATDTKCGWGWIQIASLSLFGAAIILCALAMIIYDQLMRRKLVNQHSSLASRSTAARRTGTASARSGTQGRSATGSSAASSSA
jgi:GPCR proteolysis site, GPS, motif